jgi:hypothetical protein
MDQPDIFAEPVTTVRREYPGGLGRSDIVICSEACPQIAPKRDHSHLTSGCLVPRSGGALQNSLAIGTGRQADHPLEGTAEGAVGLVSD